MSNEQILGRTRQFKLVAKVAGAPIKVGASQASVGVEIKIEAGRTK